MSIINSDMHAGSRRKKAFFLCVFLVFVLINCLMATRAGATGLFEREKVDWEGLRARLREHNASSGTNSSKESAASIATAEISSAEWSAIEAELSSARAQRSEVRQEPSISLSAHRAMDSRTNDNDPYNTDGSAIWHDVGLVAFPGSWMEKPSDDVVHQLMEQQDYDQAAIQIVKRLNNLMPADLHPGEYGYYLSWIYMHHGYSGQAYKAVVNALGRLKADLGNFTDTTHERSVSESYLLLGDIHAKSDRFDSAEKAWNRSLAACRELPVAYRTNITLRLAKLSMLSGDLIKARNLIENAETRELPDIMRAKLLVFLGDIEYHDRDLRSAATAYRQAQALSESKKALARLRMVEGLILYENQAKQGRIHRIVAEAIPLMEEAAQIAPGDEEVLFSLAYMQYIIGMGENEAHLISSAIEHFDTLADARPSFRGYGGFSPATLSNRARQHIASLNLQQKP